MNIRDIGEVNLIRAVKQMTEREAIPGLLGIGDDAAAIPQADGTHQLLTTDISIEGVHFDLGYFSLKQAGWKAMASNLSDIAAMGGKPAFALVALGVPKTYSGEKIAELYKGMTEIADMFDTRIIGGDMSSAEKLIISITLVGSIDAVEGPITRSGAGHQDILCVTGSLGKSAAGMKMLKDFAKRKTDSPNVPAFMRKRESWDEVADAHTNPMPRFKELEAILEHARPTAMIDISDGLASEVHHLCRASDRGALIDRTRLPIHKDARRVAEIFGIDPVEMALGSGEEFELLFTLPRSCAEKVCDEVRMATGTEVYTIGGMRAKSDGICITDIAGKPVPLADSGFDHFD